MNLKRRSRKAKHLTPAQAEKLVEQAIQDTFREPSEDELVVDDSIHDLTPYLFQREEETEVPTVLRR